MNWDSLLCSLKQAFCMDSGMFSLMKSQLRQMGATHIWHFNLNADRTKEGALSIQQPSRYHLCFS